MEGLTERCPDCQRTDNPCTQTYHLRQEANKWVKHFMSKPNMQNLGAARALSDFFNITEEVDGLHK